MGIQLEIGPGDCPLGGEWKTLNLPGTGADYEAEWGEDRLPLADASVDGIYTSHVIEHVPWWKTVDALRELHRILVLGGSAEIWTVDFRVCVEAYLAGNPVDRWKAGGRNPDVDPMLSVASRILATDKYDGHGWHKAIFDAVHLAKCLRAAGFTGVVKHRRTCGHRHGRCEFGMQATK